MIDAPKNMNVDYIENAIQMLQTYAREENLKPLLAILERLKQDIGNASIQAELTQTWRNLGVYQGTVLSYVPFFYTLIPDDIFGDKFKGLD